MTTVIIKDNCEENKVKFERIPNLIGKIANKTLSMLEKEGIFILPSNIKDSEDLDGAQYALTCTNNCYKTYNLMGFIGCSNEQLIISSRFSTSQNTDNLSIKDNYLTYVLQKIFKIPNLVNLFSNANCDNQMFNFLLFLFPFYLKHALRKGVFKEYKSFKYNEYNVKGKIDVNRHININTPFIGKIACSRREFSYDNPILQLIRHTLEYIQMTPQGKIILCCIKDETNIVKELTPSYQIRQRNKIIKINQKNIVNHAYYKEYSMLQKVCILILRNQQCNLGFGKDKIFGILFDGAWLWEEYINTIIKDYFSHPMNKKGEQCQWLFSDISDRKNGLIYPDFIGKNANYRLIADAKYKPITNIRGNDYLQLLAYMFRFDSNTGFFIYPELDENSEVKEFRLNKGFSMENNVKPRNNIKVIKLGLRIPQNEGNFETFCIIMRNSENNLRNTILKQIKAPYFNHCSSN